MISRISEIEASIKRHGAQVAWEKYSRTHGLDERRFRTDLQQLRVRFDRIGSTRR